MTAFKTTTVPTEWLEELTRLNGWVDKATSSNELTDFTKAISVAKLIGHINSSKYFTEQQQPNVPTPFTESIRLLRDLADFQNGAPLEQHRKEWEQTMDEVYTFLKQFEGQKQLSENVDLEEFAKFIADNFEYAKHSNLYLHNKKGGLRTFSEVLEAFKNREKSHN